MPSGDLGRRRWDGQNSLSVRFMLLLLPAHLAPQLLQDASALQAGSLRSIAHQLLDHLTQLLELLACCGEE